MNRYGTLLMRQWRQADPERFAMIPDPDSFFETKGGELELEIATLAQALAGPDRAGESYAEKTARLTSARFNAESDLIREAMIPESEEFEAPLPAEWRSLAREDPIEE
jgi:hypothetical protein